MVVRADRVTNICVGRAFKFLLRYFYSNLWWSWLSTYIETWLIFYIEVPRYSDNLMGTFFASELLLPVGLFIARGFASDLFIFVRSKRNNYKHIANKVKCHTLVHNYRPIYHIRKGDKKLKLLNFSLFFEITLFIKIHKPYQK